jgi:quercetin dioxygenase-like cupin family protein
MTYPDFMRAFPALDVPFPKDSVRIHALRSDSGLAVYFDVLKDMTVPPHSHKGQWGALFQGEIELTVDGVTRVCRPGDTWDIPAGVVHSAVLKAGAKLMDVFEEPDRYPLRPRASE